jgi:glycosyltransferase involved in cell wall biosynthesis
MNKCPLFSIIIPHKNTPDLLQRCINSIPRKDDIQIIIVDDSSDQERVDFKYFPGLYDPYIEIVFTNEKKGAGYARNVGLKKAIGKWILFADADDYFVENAFNILNNYINYNEEIIFFKSRSCYSDTGNPSNRERDNNNKIDAFMNKEKKSENNLRYYWNSPWSKMIKRDLLNRENIYFDEVQFFNDVTFSYLTGHFASSINVSSEIIYIITTSRGSLMNVNNKEADKIRYIVLLRRNNFLREIDKKDIQMSLFNKLIRSLFQYGPLFFFKLITLHIEYRDNPIMNISIFHSLRSFISFIKIKKENKDYFTKSYKNYIC